MQPLLVVEAEVVRQSRHHRRNRLVVLQKHALVLHGPPEPLDEDVVQGSPAPIDAHPRPGVLQQRPLGLSGADRLFSPSRARP